MPVERKATSSATEKIILEVCPSWTTSPLRMHRTVRFCGSSTSSRVTM
jgi:hypothetical protein